MTISPNPNGSLGRGTRGHGLAWEIVWTFGPERQQTVEPFQKTMALTTIQTKPTSDQNSQSGPVAQVSPESTGLVTGRFASSF